MMSNSRARAEQARVIRGVRAGFVPTLHCALIATVAFLFIPWKEILTRWRHTGPYLILLLLLGAEIHFYGVPWAWAILAAPPTLFFVLTIVLACLIRWRTDDMWHVRDGVDGALILISWNRRLRRHELHTWASFRHHRGLARLVVDAAFQDAPRPFWLDPATPSLREFYTAKGARPGPAGSRWMVVT